MRCSSLVAVVAMLAACIAVAVAVAAAPPAPILVDGFAFAFHETLPDLLVTDVKTHTTFNLWFNSLQDTLYTFNNTANYSSGTDVLITMLSVPSWNRSMINNASTGALSVSYAATNVSALQANIVVGFELFYGDAAPNASDAMPFGGWPAGSFYDLDRASNFTYIDSLPVLRWSIELFMPSHWIPTIVMSCQSSSTRLATTPFYYSSEFQNTVRMISSGNYTANVTVQDSMRALSTDPDGKTHLFVPSAGFSIDFDTYLVNLTTQFFYGLANFSATGGLPSTLRYDVAVSFAQPNNSSLPYVPPSPNSAVTIGTQSFSFSTVGSTTGHNHNDPELKGWQVALIVLGSLGAVVVIVVVPLVVYFMVQSRKEQGYTRF